MAFISAAEGAHAGVCRDHFPYPHLDTTAAFTLQQTEFLGHKKILIDTSIKTNKQNMEHNKDLEEFLQPNWSQS